MKNNKKIIDKICKCLRLSESGNPNEAALALRQATSLMKKYGVSDTQILAAEVTEGATFAGERYNPPFWALALANLVANAFHRYLLRAIEKFTLSVEMERKTDTVEENRRIEVFAQAWLFRVGRTVSDFIGDETDKEVIDDYIQHKYGETAELSGIAADTKNDDYDDILSGMRSADEVELYRSVGKRAS